MSARFFAIRVLSFAVAYLILAPIAGAHSIGTIDTVQALEDVIPVTVKPTMIVRGYHAPYDGGGGVFTYDSTSTAPIDGGMVVEANGPGAWLRHRDRHDVDIKWFGAKGNGSRFPADVKAQCSYDDRAAIVAAIDSLGPSGGIVSLPAGTYCLSSPIALPHRVTLRGAGRGATALVAHEAFEPEQNFNEVAVVQLGIAPDLAFSTRLEDITVDCNAEFGCIGVYSDTANEQSGLIRVAIEDAENFGVWFTRGGNYSAQNFILRDLEIIVRNHVGDPNSTIGVKLDINGGTFRGIDGLTVNGGSETENPPPGSIKTGVELNGVKAPAVLERIHLEDTVTGIDIGPDIACTGIAIIGVSYYRNTAFEINETVIRISDKDNRDITIQSLAQVGANYLIHNEETGEMVTLPSLNAYFVGYPYFRPNP